MSEKKPCVRCEQYKKLVARGLCSSCYGKVEKAGELDKYPTTRRKAGSAAPKEPTSGKKRAKREKPAPAPASAAEGCAALVNLFVALKPFDAAAREKIVDGACDLLAIAEK